MNKIRLTIQILHILIFGGASIALIAWPAPIFCLPQDLSDQYVWWLFDVPPDGDKTGLSALPMLWMFFSLPVGFAIGISGLLIYVTLKEWNIYKPLFG